MCDLGLLEANLRTLASVHERTGARILAALKGFALWSTFRLCGRYLQGTTASSVNEARLGREEFAGEVHVCAPAYSDDDFPRYLALADHVVFNSLSQWRRLRGLVASSGRPVSCGLRVNPGHSEVSVELYDPCAPGSRLGVRRENLRPEDLDGLEGLHFHSLCEQGADVLERTLAVFERSFGEFLPRLRWVNFGGGHHITRESYDVELLCRMIDGFRSRYGVEVYLEPGEAIGLDCGVLVSTVLDVVPGSPDTAILDTSAAAHMPDVLEMPYRPEVVGAAGPGEKAYTYRLGGLTCLAGDVVGDYSFDEPLEVGRRIAFLDMIHYTMVKNTTFNGVNLPAIVLYDPARDPDGDADGDAIRVVRRFGYEDYKGRLS